MTPTTISEEEIAVLYEINDTHTLACIAASMMGRHRSQRPQDAAAEKSRQQFWQTVKEVVIHRRRRKDADA